MASTSYAEKLIILDSHVSGLLCRIHDMINIKRILQAQIQQGVSSQAGLDELLHTELPKFVQALVRRFPETPEQIEKIPGYDIFNKRYPEIQTGLQPFYHTWLDILHAKETVWATLLDCVRMFTVMKFDVNRFIMSKFLDLFVKYCQMIILSSRVEDRRGLIMLYAQAHHKTGNTEPSFPRIADFIKQYESPVKQLRDECGDLADRLGEIVMGFQMPVLTWSDINNFHMKSVFNILEDTKTMNVQSKDKEYNELQYLDSFHTWIMWTYLICPQALQTEGSIPMLLTCLKEHMIITLFRDETLEIHHEMNDLFSNFKVKKSPKDFKLSKHSKALKEIQNAAQDTVIHYQKLRNYLNCEMDVLLQFLEEYPGCIAPKINMILAITTLARNCVVWYLRHVNPIKKPKNYVFGLDWAGVASLIRLNYAFKDLVLKYSDSVEVYYKAQVLLDAAKIEELLQAFRQQNDPTTIINQLMDSILEDCRNGKTCDDTRLNWYRLSTALFHVYSNLKESNIASMCSRFIELISHSRHIDLLHTEVNAAGNFMNLMWAPEKVSVLAQSAPSKSLLAVIRTLSDSVQNLHKNAGEEAHLIVQVSQKISIDLLYQVAANILTNINVIKTEIKKRRADTSHAAVLRKMDDPSLPLPGFESVYDRRNYTEPVRVAKQNIASLCEGVAEQPRFHVCLIEFFPLAYVREELVKGLRRELFEGVVPRGSSSSVINKPSEMLVHFKDVMYAYTTVEQFMNINMTNMFREMLFNGFCDAKAGGPGDPLINDLPTAAENTYTGGCMIEMISRFYTHLFNAPELLTGFYPYSQTLRSFVNFPNRHHTVDYQSYTDPEELMALCSLIGPYGVRILDSRLLEVVVAHVANIKKVLAANQTHLTALVGKSMYSQTWSTAVQSISNADRDILAQSAARVGAVLKFRKDLRSALGSVVSNGVPLLYSTVALAHATIHDFERVNPDQLPMDMLASDCGIDVGEADHALRQALTKFKTNNNDVQQWVVLPEMFALAIKSTFWSKARYSVALDGHFNNAHCIGECLIALIVNFARINIAHGGQKPDDKVKEDLERSVRCASYSILHMYRANIHDESVHHSMMFIEMLIHRSGGRVEFAFLEECFPYTLLRTNYIQLYERQTSKDGTAYATADALNEDVKAADGELRTDGSLTARAASSIAIASPQ